MSVYFVKMKGWRYDFTLKGERLTASWFKTKREAMNAEAKRKEAVNNPQIEAETRPDQTGTDITFLELVNLRLDHSEAYHSKKYYIDFVCYAKGWVKQWGDRSCRGINNNEIYSFILKRSKVSNCTANKEIRLLKALFNFGIKKKLLDSNPVDEIDFLPVEKKIKYIPSGDNVLQMIHGANPDQQDYLWTIALTLGRVNEINALCWNDVDFEKKSITLYTRKKKGGSKTPRVIPMPDRLLEIMKKRFAQRDSTKPWVFWHRNWDRKKKAWIDKPYTERSQLMKILCKRAGVRYFRFHALRHYGASQLDHRGVPLGSIQKILGHENRATTEIYLHSVGQAERTAMDVLNESF